MRYSFNVLSDKQTDRTPVIRVFSIAIPNAHVKLFLFIPFNNLAFYLFFVSLFASVWQV